MILPFIIISSLLLDLAIGELRKFHPLVGFGKLANWLEIKINNNHNSGDQFQAALQTSEETLQQYWRVIKGGGAVVILISPFLLLLIAINHLMPPLVSVVINILVLYWAIGHQSLREHANRVLEKCLSNDLISSRQQLQMIVSRNTERLNQEQIIQSTVETVLENGNDAIFAPLFWFFLFETLIGLGSAAVLLYRLSNTLDAMWGYRNQRFNYFGCFAARLDDVLNYVPARLVALSYALFGNTQLALQCWQQQSPLLKSPNAGPVMTAGAGSLNIRLGGPAYYHQAYTEKPYFGSDIKVETTDIKRSLLLIRNSIILWCVLISAISLLIFVA